MFFPIFIIEEMILWAKWKKRLVTRRFGASGR